MDIVLVTTSARINRMPARRQKRALKRRPTKVLTNVYPLNVGAGKEIVPNSDGTVTVTMKFGAQ